MCVTMGLGNQNGSGLAQSHEMGPHIEFGLGLSLNNGPSILYMETELAQIHSKKDFFCNHYLMVNQLIGSQDRIGLKVIKFQLINNPRMTQAHGKHLIQNNWINFIEYYLVCKILINHSQIFFQLSLPIKIIT